jgi:hypothetical protein
VGDLEEIGGTAREAREETNIANGIAAIAEFFARRVTISCAM